MTPSHYEKYKNKYGTEAADRERNRRHMRQSGYLSKRELAKREEEANERIAKYYR